MPVGSYEIILHFAELFWETEGSRKMNINVEDSAFFNEVDIVQLGGGVRNKAFTVRTVTRVAWEARVCVQFAGLTFFDSWKRRL